jgi:hypothetical protein
MALFAHRSTAVIAGAISALKTFSCRLSLQNDDWRVLSFFHLLWVQVQLTRQVGLGRWPNQRLSGLRWLIFLLCGAIDRNMGLLGPF